jgi:uncharacterized protein (DUF1499 family)
VRIFIGVIVLVGALFGGSMFWQASKSRSTEGNTGRSKGELTACTSGKPNCVSTQSEPDSDFYIAPINSENILETWAQLLKRFPELGLEIVKQTDTYVHATAQTPLLKFIDDVEFLLDANKGVIQMKSESRVGYSDLGANRKRLEKIRSKLQKP